MNIKLYIAGILLAHNLSSYAADIPTKEQIQEAMIENFKEFSKDKGSVTAAFLYYFLKSDTTYSTPFIITALGKTHESIKFSPDFKKITATKKGNYEFNCYIYAPSSDFKKQVNVIYPIYDSSGEINEKTINLPLIDCQHIGNSLYFATFILPSDLIEDTTSIKIQLGNGKPWIYLMNNINSITLLLTLINVPE